MIRVMIVDDQDIIRAGLASIVDAQEGLATVAQAADGFAAITALDTVEVDVVLMDLRMPGIDGDEATARILSTTPSARVIILTTYESDASILTAIEAGASGYLLKAAPQDEILAGVRSVARGEVALAPSIAAMLVQRVARPAVTLSPRETQVLALVAQGSSNPAIAAELFLSEATVKTHLLHVFEKLGVSDRTRAVTLAMELRLL